MWPSSSRKVYLVLLLPWKLLLLLGHNNNVTALSSSSSSSNLLKLPTATGVAQAYDRFGGGGGGGGSSSGPPLVVRTPLLESPLLNQQLSCQRLFVKAECLQRTGSFKYRGALNRLLTTLDDEASAANKGVVAFSSGNFGQALAAAATSLNIPCCIVSPHDAPTIKLDRIQKLGARLVLSTAKEGENREVVASALANEIAQTQQMTLLHPFEDIDVVHGQGTCGMELLDQYQELMGGGDDEEEEENSSLFPDVIVVPCGGGGLTAGINLAVEYKQQQQQRGGGKNTKTTATKVYTIEPKGYDDHAKSFESGKRLSLAEIYPPQQSTPSKEEEDRSKYCDALMAGAPGQVTWEINQSRLAGALESGGDDSAANAMKIAFDHYRLVLEPSGALALAAILDNQIPNLQDKTVVVIASGGNTDLETFAKLMGCSGGDEAPFGGDE